MFHLMCIVGYVSALMDRLNHAACHMIFCPAFLGALSVPFSSLLTKFDIVCTVHCNQFINKPKWCTLCTYLFYNHFATLHVSNDSFVHHQEFI